MDYIVQKHQLKSFMLTGQLIVVLLKCTQLTNTKWQLPQQNAMSVLWYWETKSVIPVQRHYHREYGEQASGTQSVK
jgi:hypothetical protein